MSNLLLSIFSVLVGFDFARLLCRCFGSIIADLIAKENFWAVNFTSLDKRVAKDLTSWCISALLLAIDSVDYLQCWVASCRLFAAMCNDGLIHGSRRSLRSQRWRQVSFQLWVCWIIGRGRVRHLLFSVLQTFKIHQTCHWSLYCLLEMRIDTILRVKVPFCLSSLDQDDGTCCLAWLVCSLLLLRFCSCKWEGSSFVTCKLLSLIWLICLLTVQTN